MNTVKVRSYAKVNLTLEINGAENGYHQLDSLVTSVDLFDLIALKKRKDRLSSITMHGMDSESIPPEKNNALKAAERFSERFGVNGAQITIYKNIPIGAGLGGSSADICGVLNGMAKLYGITDKAALKGLADELGSDTGYMLTGGFARMQGRGEQVTLIPTDVKLHFLLLCPQSEISAGACYRAYDELQKRENASKKQESATENCISALLQKSEKDVGRYLMNDLFLPATTLNDDVKTAMKEALEFSPLGAVMTGSGSCVLAMFETKELCQWAQSRYRGKFRAFVVETVNPDREQRIWHNPFALKTDGGEE
ncbi:MAG: 4-(cytidine 5'-diphospho)-2-C-methyl-D-erythritol kinase [Clostridia bacterium]|nr:4-(cytidine 5'-diphospho)-2-C-methyl-D-erythritol kinase [Clostridia bacterium]